MKLTDLSISERFSPYSEKMMEYVKEKNSIYEGLITSQPCGYVVSKIKTHYPNVKCSYEPNKGNKFQIVLNTNQITNQQLNELFKLLNNYGWFSSQVYFGSMDYRWTPDIFQIITDTITNNQSELIEMQFEAKYDIELESKLIPNKLYHATPTKFVKKILKQGIVPTSKNPLFTYPDRIYLSYHYDDLTKVSLPYMAKKSNIFDWTIFEINVGLLKNQNIPLTRWFKDPNYNGGIYILKNIPPQMIQIITQCKF